MYSALNFHPHAAASFSTDLVELQDGPTSIWVTWTPPTLLGDTTGYRIFYSGGSSGSVNISGGSTDNYLLTDLQNGAHYTIFIVGTSRHFSSRCLVHLNNNPLGELLLNHIVSISDTLLSTSSVPGKPTGVVSSSTVTTISLSWTSVGSVVGSYEVMWERHTSVECPDEDEGSATMMALPATP